MFLRQVFDPDLAQYAYIVGCQRTGEALVIDPERDVERYLDIAAAEGLRIVAAAETHIHADFLSGVRELAERHGARAYLSAEGGPDWSYGWPREGTHDVRLLRDGDVFEIGNIRIQAVHTPGHTPEHLAFLVTDMGGGASEPIGIASGDFVFVGDLGRPDLLETAAGVVGAREPSARRLWESTRRFLELEDHLQVWPGHGAGSACGKALGAVPQSTVGYERRFNAALAFGAEDDFVRSILEGQPEPPLYFARMKVLNREGPPILGELPAPGRCRAEDLAGALASDDAVVVDTRRDRAGFMAAHVPGSIYAPLGIDFAMVVGSYVQPSERIHLIVDEDELERTVRILVRIGYDRIAGFMDPSAMEAAGVTTAAIPRVDFPELDADIARDRDLTLLDVRTASEFEASHLPGALNISHTRLAERLAEVPRDRPVLAYCRSGNRASSAASLLEREGYDVTLVDGPLARWPGWDRRPAPAGQR